MSKQPITKLTDNSTCNEVPFPSVLKFPDTAVLVKFGTLCRFSSAPRIPCFRSKKLVGPDLCEGELSLEKLYCNNPRDQVILRCKGPKLESGPL